MPGHARQLRSRGGRDGAYTLSRPPSTLTQHYATICRLQFSRVGIGTGTDRGASDPAPATLTCRYVTAFPTQRAATASPTCTPTAGDPEAGPHERQEPGSSEYRTADYNARGLEIVRPAGLTAGGAGGLSLAAHTCIVLHVVAWLVMIPLGGSSSTSSAATTTTAGPLLVWAQRSSVPAHGLAPSGSKASGREGKSQQGCARRVWVLEGRTLRQVRSSGWWWGQGGQLVVVNEPRDDRCLLWVLVCGCRLAAGAVVQ